MTPELRRKIEEAAIEYVGPSFRQMFIDGAEFALSLKPEPGSEEDDERSVGLEDDGYAFGTVLDAHLAGSANVRKQIPALVEAAVLKERERIIQVVKVFGGAGWNRERLEDLIINPSPKEPTK